MTIGKLRSALYGAAKVLGDVQAVRKGNVVKRAVRRVAGRLAGRILGRLFR